MEENVKSQAPLLNLPVEILLSIESYLLYQHAISLSLTCKKAYNLFFQRNRSTGRRHGREKHLLRLLERDYQSLLTCPIHEILYAWRKQKGKRYQCPRRCGVGDSMVICNKGCRVGFQGIFDAERRLMIRHSFLGPEYGISMRSLDHVCKRSKSKMANEVTPKVTGKSLMVWRTHNYTTRIDFVLWDDIAIDHDFNEAICVHSERHLRALVVACVVHARRRRKWLLKASTPSRSYLNELISWQCPTLFKCPQCATDVRLSMTQVSAGQINIRFDVFQDLGGLEQMSLARYQVLGTRLGMTAQNLDRREKITRLTENLERRYFGQRETAERYCQGVPWNTAILGQWWYNFAYSSENPMLFRPDNDIPKPIWISYRRIRFKRESHIKLQTWSSKTLAGMKGASSKQ